MIALVTGASRLPGDRLVQQLAADGVEIRILARRGAHQQHLTGLPMEASRAVSVTLML
jgi:uncharacterized protein YbjT (DUF2867 family)